MSHPVQIRYCSSIRDRFPDKFKNVSVLDCGSLDINGNNRYLFTGESDYVGIDVGEGKNVDIVCSAHEFKGGPFDVVVSTEMLEHNKQWLMSIHNMISMVKSGGILLITCAGFGRQEHGTTRTSPEDAPFTNDYYMNMQMSHFAVFSPDECFSYYELSKEGTDIRFFGIKK